MFELMHVETMAATIKLISTGEESRKAFDQIQIPIEGLDHIDDPAVARGEEDAIREQVQNVDMLFIATSAIHASEVELTIKIQQIARELEILTIVLVQVPMAPESIGQEIAKPNLSLLQSVYTLLIVQSEPVTSQKAATGGQGLAIAAKGIIEIITTNGLICVDFADVRSVISEKGIARMGTGWSVGESRAKEAANKAVGCLSRQEFRLFDAKGVLINIAAGLDLGIDEVDEVGTAVKEHCSETAAVVLGTTLDPDMEGLHVTIIAAGLD